MEMSFSRLSEQRVHDLLEGLCNDVSRTNMLYTSAEGNQSWAKVAQPGWTRPSKPEEEGSSPWSRRCKDCTANMSACLLG